LGCGVKEEIKRLKRAGYFKVYFEKGLLYQNKRFNFWVWDKRKNKKTKTRWIFGCVLCKKLTLSKQII
jgi:RNase P protein component